MHRSRHLPFVAALMILGSWTCSAKAAIITYRFSGVVTSVNDPSGVGPLIIPGQSTFVGTFSFDDAAVDRNPSLSVGDYTNPGEIGSTFTILIDRLYDFGHAGPTTSDQIRLFDNFAISPNDVRDEFQFRKTAPLVLQR